MISNDDVTVSVITRALAMRKRKRQQKHPVADTDISFNFYTSKETFFANDSRFPECHNYQELNGSSDSFYNE